MIHNQKQHGENEEEKGEGSIFWWGRSEPCPVPPLVANPDPHKKTLRRVLGLITVIT